MIDIISIIHGGGTLQQLGAPSSEDIGIKKNDEITFSKLVWCIRLDLFDHFKQCDSGHDVWTTRQNLFESTKTVKDKKLRHQHFQ